MSVTSSQEIKFYISEQWKRDEKNVLKPRIKSGPLGLVFYLLFYAYVTRLAICHFPFSIIMILSLDFLCQLFSMRTVIKGNEITLYIIFRKSPLLTEGLYKNKGFLS